MAYFSKNAILKAYKQLSKLSSDPTAQGATQRVSALRYFVALDNFYAVFRKDCDTKDSSHKESYTGYVGDVISVTEDLYTGNFYFPLSHSQGDYNIGSNFYSVNVVAMSKQNPTMVYDFPRRGKNPLMEVQNGVLLRKQDYYPNLSHYLNNNVDMKAAFVVWLLRGAYISNNNYEGIKLALINKFTKEFVDELMPSDSLEYTYNDYLDFSQNKSTLEELDIRSIVVTSTPVKTGASKSGKAFDVKNLTPTILYGPPGTGKTFRMQEDYINRFDKDNRFVTTFHQSFSYEDFVEGLKPLLDGYDSENITYQIEKGVFRQACERAALIAGFNSLEESINDANRQETYDKAIKDGKIVLLCIDEINRANVSAVFGDLISLIEDSKRIGAKNELTVRLPYSKKEFGVPKNLMIIGTMNTADRSIQLLDSALRRRFRFEELLPDYSVLDDKSASILKAINAKIRCYLGKDSQIGHSYFIDMKNDLDIFVAMRDKVLPLLEEYFYGEIEKIRKVLNETEKNNSAYFYVEDKAATEFHKEFDDEYEEGKSFYEVNTKLGEVSTEDGASKYLAHLLPTEE